MRNINNLRANSAAKAPMSPANNQKESREIKYPIAAKRLPRAAAGRLQFSKLLQILERTFCGSLSVLINLAFSLKNLIFCGTFQESVLSRDQHPMHPPHICDLGYGPYQSNGC
jgi:hypothetical protein